MEFRRARRRHPGIESAIAALQSGNGQARCRDRSFGGYCRYVGLGVLGRNLHVLGKSLIARADPKCEAGRSRRRARLPETRSGSQAGWNHALIVVVRLGCAAGIGRFGRLASGTGHRSAKMWLEHIRDRPGRRFSAACPEELGTFPTATSSVPVSSAFPPPSSVPGPPAPRPIQVFYRTEQPPDLFTTETTPIGEGTAQPTVRDWGPSGREPCRRRPVREPPAH